ncbi:conserved hypothetical protein [Ricinus communis]|uniref:Uncharacterized protein n=1 Tax=Ricinus communis TaxID=3988 RepID=B9T582_RICCO|nr:conserved hypothetical protein [Ricinus communis]
MSNTGGNGSNQACDKDQGFPAVWRAIEEYRKSTHYLQQQLTKLVNQFTLMGANINKNLNGGNNQAGGVNFRRAANVRIPVK